MSAASSGLIMIRASEPPMKRRRPGFIEFGAVIRSPGLISIGILLVCLPISSLVTSTHVTMAQLDACDKCTGKNGARRAQLDRSGARGSDRPPQEHHHQHRGWPLRGKPRLPDAD